MSIVLYVPREILTDPLAEIIIADVLRQSVQDNAGFHLGNTW